jgi:hypothetical protein
MKILLWDYYNIYNNYLRKCFIYKNNPLFRRPTLYPIELRAQNKRM